MKRGGRGSGRGMQGHPPIDMRGAIPIGQPPGQQQQQGLPGQQQPDAVTLKMPEGHVLKYIIGFSGEVEVYPDGELMLQGAMIIMPKCFMFKDSTVYRLINFVQIGHPFYHYAVPFPQWWEKREELAVPLT